MIRFRWLPACLLATLMTAGICWGQASCPKPTQPAGTTRAPYYYELVDVLFSGPQVAEVSETSEELGDEAQDDSADECSDECCDCAAEWIPIMVDDCMKMWSLLWDLGSFKEAAHLADEAWRLDPSNLSTMQARTLSHIALAMNFKPTGGCSAQPACPKATLRVGIQMGCCGFGFACCDSTSPAAACKPTNACGMGCGHSSGCAPCATVCQPVCTGSTCAVTDCCHDKPTPCGTCPAPVSKNSCGAECVPLPCGSSPCTVSCPKSGCSPCKTGSCCMGPASCAACPTCETPCCNEKNYCTTGSCSCAKDSCCCSKSGCTKECKCSSGGKCCCAKNGCACQQTMCELLKKIFALMKEQDNKSAGVCLPPCMAPHPVMAMPCMPGMCCPPPVAGMCPPPAPPMVANQPWCMPGMPCPATLVSRPMEANTVPQPLPRAPLPPQWVVGDVLPNPPMIQVHKEDIRINVTPHGKRIHVNCNTFDATCDRLTTCEAGERIVMEGNVRLTMQTGNKPGKVSAQRVEVYVPDGSVELVPDSTSERPVEPVHYQQVPSPACPFCPPAVPSSY